VATLRALSSSTLSSRLTPPCSTWRHIQGGVKVGWF
jgi:hypothetical protein